MIQYISVFSLGVIFGIIIMCIVNMARDKPR